MLYTDGLTNPKKNEYFSINLKNNKDVSKKNL